MIADLATLKRHLGVTSTNDDAVLADVLAAATSWVEVRVYVASFATDEVQLGIVMLAARFYKRRQSPEGVVGWSPELAFRIVANDPDIAALLEGAWDMTKAGVA